MFTSADTESSAQPLEKRKLSRKELHFYVNSLIIELSKKEFQDKLREEAQKEPLPRTGDELLDRFEVAQAAFFSTLPLKVPASDDGAEAGSGATGETKVVFCDGEYITAQTKTAAKTFPDVETERLLIRMCTALEAQVASISTTVPELRHLAMDAASAGGHGHSHGGQPCNHNHNHNHSHGHGHGHGRGGNVMPNPTPEMERMVQMAMGTLSPEQKATVERVQQTMNNGSPPSPEDMQKMFLVQQHIMAFMTTMEKFMGGGGGAAAGNGGRGGRKM